MSDDGYCQYHAEGGKWLVWRPFGYVFVSSPDENLYYAISEDTAAGRPQVKQRAEEEDTLTV